MHPDIPEEQAYFDHALDLRERLEANLDRAASLAADPKTAMELRRRVGALGVVDPGQAVAFGRIDVDGDRWYIGRGAIWDENNDLVVVNWQAPIAAPFYTARPGHSEGLDRRRIFRCRDNRILDIDELVFREVERAIRNGASSPAAGSADRDDRGARATGRGGRGPGTGRHDQGAGVSRGRAPQPVVGRDPGDRPADVVGRSTYGGVGDDDAASRRGRPGRAAYPGGVTDVSSVLVPGTGVGSDLDTGPGTGAVPVAEPVVTDALLEALGRERSGHLSEIVATIQAAQYDVISHDAEQLLVVQGAPGTGKTVVGLHRVSWLLFNRRDRLTSRDVLVVGPNPAFLRYVSAVLPSLGDEAVVQLPVVALGPRVRIGRVDPPEVRRLKGDRRMLRFVLRGLRSRQRVGRSPVELTVEGRHVELDAGDLASRARQLAGQPHNEVRGHLRSFMVDEAQRQLARRRSRETAMLDASLQSAITHEVDTYLDRAWPRMTPQGFLVELLASRRRREVAGAGLLSADETELLAIPHGLNVSSLTWAVDDIPLLDLADALLNGVPATYQYIVVDEAQDLSPMQFESIRRRSRTGWMTVLGDLAQATSPWTPASWEEVVLHLRRDRVPTDLTELSLGYRLPTEVHDVAMRLLPEIAPGLKAPRPLRTTGHEVDVTATRPAELAGAVVRAVRACSGGLVGVITPAADRARVRDALEAEGLACASELGAFPAPPIVVLGCEDAKGLEFDNVVVVEPAAIVGESPYGLRALFVALTRPTNRLALVHAQPLPEALGLHSPLPGTEPPRVEARPFEERLTEPVEIYRGGDRHLGDLDDVDRLPSVDDGDGVGGVGMGGMGEVDDEDDEVPVVGGRPYLDWRPEERRRSPGQRTTIVLNPPGGTTTGGATGPGTGGIGAGVGTSGGVGGNGMGYDERAVEAEPPPPPSPGGNERSALPVPGANTSTEIDVRADPFAALDREMAHALAKKLAEALTRYATPALVPLVIDQMAEILEADKPRVTRTGQDSAP
jgi:DNA helicase IV